MNNHSQVLSARWIIPVTGNPINGGWVRIQGGRVVEMGSKPAPCHAQPLGDVAIFPGLVNAHTHLEFSDCQRPIGESGISLPEWIGKVISTRQSSDETSREQAIGIGIGELVKTGTCLAGEITTPPCEYPGNESGLDLVPFAEVLGLSAERGSQRLELARSNLRRYPQGGVSPHAPYSTSRETLGACFELARKHHRPIAMHVAESPAERELLRTGTGPFADALQSLGVWEIEQFPWPESPFLKLIEQLASAPRSLLVHGNDLNESEIRLLAEYPHITVVFCPRTHHFFRYDSHPVDQLLSSGVRVALGTDSRASNPDLNLWNEVQFLLNHRSDLDPLSVFRMATWSGSEALGRTDIGCIRPGCIAKFGMVSSDASSLEDLFGDCAMNGYEPLWQFAA
jgi:cytosine/adenosine deaminase-related metal-dependent hydrolase